MNTELLPTLFEGDLADLELARMGLDRERLRWATSYAHHWRLSATAHHPVSTAGTLAWHYGVQALRDAFVGEDWEAIEPGNMPYIRNVRTGVRVGVWNVSCACDRVAMPQKISSTGKNTDAALEANIQGTLDLRGGSIAAIEPSLDQQTWFLMNALDGKSELSLVGSGGTFLRRIFILEDPERDGIDLLVDNDDQVDDFDIAVEQR